jgi:hypothetical protein
MPGNRRFDWVKAEEASAIRGVALNYGSHLAWFRIGVVEIESRTICLCGSNVGLRLSLLIPVCRGGTKVQTKRVYHD